MTDAKPKNRRYTKSDDDYIGETMHRPIEEVCKALGRSVSSIEARRKRWLYIQRIKRGD